MIELVKITDHIYCFDGVEETDRPNLYYILGKEFSCAVDAGNSKKNVDLFYQAIRKMNFPLPSYTIITHWHWDHTFGMPFVNGKTIVSKATNEKLKDVMTWEWTYEKMKEREVSGQDIPFCNEHIIREYEELSDIKVCLGDIIVDDKLILDLKDITLEIRTIEANHSDDSLIVYCKEDKALIVGDADCENDYELKGGFSLKKVKAYKEEIMKYDFNTYLIGHDVPSDREELIGYLEDCIKEAE